METDWRSIYVLTIVGFLGSFKISAMATGLWAYMKIIDPTVTESFYGGLSSASNLCNLGMSLLAGVISNRLADTKFCMVSGKSLWILAVLAFLVVERLPGHMKLMVVMMETCFGISMGLMSVSRTHIAMASSEADRPRAVSIMSLTMTLGMAVGPAIIAALSLLDYPGYALPLGLHLNMYTAPVYLILLTTLVSLWLLLAHYDGRMRVAERPQKPAAAGRSRFATSYDKVAVAMCCLTRVVMCTNMIFLITVGGPYSMLVFRWTSAELTRYTAFMHTVVGMLGVSVSVSYLLKLTQRFLSERVAILGALVMNLSYFVLTYPFPFLAAIRYEVLDANGTVLQPGCPRRFAWCAETPAVNVWVYCLCTMLIIGLSFPLIMLNLDVLYSKVLGPIKQGTMQGVFLVTGEGLSIVGPVLLSVIYEATGPVYIWQFNLLIISLVIVLWFVFYRRMVSAAEREECSRATTTSTDPTSTPELVDDQCRNVTSTI